VLITSNAMKGKCPVCGAANCACGGPSNVIAVDERMTKAGSGPLRLYPQGRGRYIQLNDVAARALGLLPPETKMKDSAPNKMRRPGPNKARG
jgi:hypothetical protein